MIGFLPDLVGVIPDSALCFILYIRISEYTNLVTRRMNDEAVETYERAAQLFAVLSTPIRLRIIGELCQGERNVGQLLSSIDVAQSNMSQHLNMMYRSGILNKRRQGAQMYYRMANESTLMVCRAVCAQVAKRQRLNS